VYGKWMREGAGRLPLTRLRYNQADVVRPDWPARCFADDLHIARDTLNFGMVLCPLIETHRLYAGRIYGHSSALRNHSR
jgi:hypothetical protein